MLKKIVYSLFICVCVCTVSVSLCCVCVQFVYCVCVVCVLCVCSLCIVYVCAVCVSCVCVCVVLISVRGALFYFQLENLHISVGASCVIGLCAEILPLPQLCLFPHKLSV